MCINKPADEAGQHIYDLKNGPFYHISAPPHLKSCVRACTHTEVVPECTTCPHNCIDCYMYISVYIIFVTHTQTHITLTPCTAHTHTHTHTRTRTHTYTHTVIYVANNNTMQHDVLKAFSSYVYSHHIPIWHNPC